MDQAIPFSLGQCHQCEASINTLDRWSSSAPRLVSDGWLCAACAVALDSKAALEPDARQCVLPLRSESAPAEAAPQEHP